MLYTNGHYLISTKNDSNLIKTADELGLARKHFDPLHHRYELPDHVSAEQLRKVGVQFAFGQQWFEIVCSEEYKQRLGKSRTGKNAPSPVVRKEGDCLVRKCPSCHQDGYVLIYAEDPEMCIRYISSPDWECIKCQRWTEQVRFDQNQGATR